MLIVQSNSKDIYRNLAIEEYLMEHATELGPVLFLWQSDCAVVLGKNQNPWRECRLDLMREESVPLARRISGGGTVYHDAGNLNYCVIVERTGYREEQAYELIFRSLDTFDIQVEKTGKSNLCANGLKFSGNAFCFRKGRALHHGTLLLHTDLDRLNRYLGSMFDSIETHAIRSVPAEVGNLNLTVEDVSTRLLHSFEHFYEQDRLVHWTEMDLDQAALSVLEEKHRSFAWQFGATPRFTINWEGQQIEVEKGRVKTMKSEESDIREGQPFDELVFRCSE
jgi:lipoate-protein ligase A